MARADVGALVAGNALPDDVLVAQQFGFHAHADQVDPVARIEIRVELIDRARIGARSALPAAVDVLAAGQRRDFFFQRLVIIRNHPALDERAPVAGNVHPLDFEVLVDFEVFGADQGFLMNGHGSVQ
jgi:hypothetical protein